MNNEIFSLEGKTAIVTGAAGAKGECLESQGTLATDKLFTGQRLDGTGLYYYNSRYYDPVIGRCISPDTFVPNFANPQAFNRYSYCLNNPLKYVDPTGYDYVPFATVQLLGEEFTLYADDVTGTSYASNGYSQTGEYADIWALLEASAGYIYQYTGNPYYDEGVNRSWEINAPVNGVDNLVTLVPEGSRQANSLKSIDAIGISLPLVGTYVRYDKSVQHSTLNLVKSIQHESFHSYERTTQGASFDAGYVASIVKSYALYDFSGKTFFEGPHNVMQDEVQAREFSGDPAHPYPMPELRSFWKERIGKKILDWLRVNY